MLSNVASPISRTPLLLHTHDPDPIIPHVESIGSQHKFIRQSEKSIDLIIKESAQLTAGHLTSKVQQELEDCPVFAIGDIHGHLNYALNVLRGAKLINEEGHWIGGQKQLVFTGDYLDKGPYGLQTYRFIKRLKSEAPEQVHILLGNHEITNLANEPYYKETFSRTGPNSFEQFKQEMMSDILTKTVQACYTDGTRFYSHAGLHPQIYDGLKSTIHSSSNKQELEELVNKINTRLLNEVKMQKYWEQGVKYVHGFGTIRQPNFLEDDPIFFKGVTHGGNNVLGGIFWLDGDKHWYSTHKGTPFTQINGHTQFKKENSLGCHIATNEVCIDIGMCKKRLGFIGFNQNNTMFEFRNFEFESNQKEEHYLDAWQLWRSHQFPASHESVSNTAFPIPFTMAIPSTTETPRSEHASHYLHFEGVDNSLGDPGKRISIRDKGISISQHSITIQPTSSTFNRVVKVKGIGEPIIETCTDINRYHLIWSSETATHIMQLSKVFRDQSSCVPFNLLSHRVDASQYLFQIIEHPGQRPQNIYLGRQSQHLAIKFQDHISLYKRVANGTFKLHLDLPLNTESQVECFFDPLERYLTINEHTPSSKAVMCLPLKENQATMSSLKDYQGVAFSQDGKHLMVRGQGVSHLLESHTLQAIFKLDEDLIAASWKSTNQIVAGITSNAELVLYDMNAEATSARFSLPADLDINPLTLSVDYDERLAQVEVRDGSGKSWIFMVY